MAPKKVENGDAADSASADPVAILLKDVTFWRAMARYGARTEQNIDIVALKEIGGLANSTAYAYMAKAKKAEGVPSGAPRAGADENGTTPKKPKAPKKGTKRARNDDEDAGDGGGEGEGEDGEDAPKSPKAPKTPKTSKTPKTPKTPRTPKTPKTPEASEALEAPAEESAEDEEV